MLHDLRTPTPQATMPARRSGLLGRIRRRRHLAARDRLSAHVATLHRIRTLIADARNVLGGGWVQNGWFSYRDEGGALRTVTAQNLPDVADRPVTGACLVGAIVQAGGGPAAAQTQPVQRALDLTWHTLYGGQQPIRWCPAPAIRLAHVRDLTRWNDDPDRAGHEVTELLDAADRVAVAEIDRLRSAGG